MRKSEKEIERAREVIEKLSIAYKVPASFIVWAGNNKYIIIKDGKECWVECSAVAL